MSRITANQNLMCHSVLRPICVSDNLCPEDCSCRSILWTHCCGLISFCCIAETLWFASSMSTAWNMWSKWRRLCIPGKSCIIQWGPHQYRQPVYFFEWKFWSHPVWSLKCAPLLLMLEFQALFARNCRTLKWQTKDVICKPLLWSSHTKHYRMCHLPLEHLDATI